MSAPIDVLAGERDARTIYDIACIREERRGASREDVEFKAIALRNYQFCAAVAELIEAAKRANGDHTAPHDCYATGPLTGDPIRDLVSCPGCELSAALARVGGAK